MYSFRYYSVHTDRKTDEQKGGHGQIDLNKNICTLWGRKRFILPVTYFPTNLVYPFTLRSISTWILNAAFFTLGCVRICVRACWSILVPFWKKIRGWDVLPSMVDVLGHVLQDSTERWQRNDLRTLVLQPRSLMVSCVTLLFPRSDVPCPRWNYRISIDDIKPINDVCLMNLNDLRRSTQTLRWAD